MVSSPIEIDLFPAASYDKNHTNRETNAFLFSLILIDSTDFYLTKIPYVV